MRKYLQMQVTMLVILVGLSACQGSQPEQPAQEGTHMELELTSSAFETGDTIPRQYTCDGSDISPPLSWSEPPPNSESLALICDDPDAPAGTWDHWVLFDIPATARSLAQGVPGGQVVEGVGVHGSNSWGDVGYGGPCPPKGPAHHYLFKLYALDVRLDLQAGASKQDVEQAMQGHILAEGQLMGVYGR